LLNPGLSADDKAALEIIQQFGATVSQNREEIIIESSGVQPVANEISCGESGLVCAYVYLHCSHCFPPDKHYRERQFTNKATGIF
jgi:hypothetical protein